MGIFDSDEQRIQKRADQAREQQLEKLWRTQCLPRFVDAGLCAEQIETARTVFYAGFDAGWTSHQAFLMGEFIREDQKQKVHLA